MKKIWIFFSILLSVCLSAGCRPDAVEIQASSETAQEPTAAITDPIIQEERFPEGAIYQWAVSGTASSEFSSPEWSADQAAGAPDSPGCGDYQFAWASAASDSIDTLVIEYAILVFPLEIVVYESFNPDQVVKVEVQDPENGGFYTVLQKNPVQVDRPCPYELVIPAGQIGFKTNTIRITLDQSQLGLGWNEIDAVELIGVEEQP